MASALAAATLGTVPARAEDSRFVGIGTGSLTGTYYPVGSLIASVLSSPPGARPCGDAGGCGVPNLILVAETSKGSVANVEAISGGRIATGFAQSDVAYGAYSGTGVFAGKEPMASLRALASLYVESVHLVVTAISGIKRVGDLRGRRVSLDVEGSGTLIDALAVLEAFGLAPSDLTAVHVPQDRAIDLMTGGALDALFIVAGYPAATVTELTRTIGAQLVPIFGEPVGRLLASHRFLTLDDIPGDTYPGVDSGTPTVGVAALWLTAADFDEGLAYQITSALFDPLILKKLAEGHPKGGSIALAHALRGVAVPLHPGAARFYRERGLAE
jgi:uncharacterized protein